MSREIEGYRDNLARLAERFPEREAISISEAAQIIGVDYRVLSADRSFPARKVGRRTIVPIAGLARWMAGGN